MKNMSESDEFMELSTGVVRDEDGENGIVRDEDVVCCECIL